AFPSRKINASVMIEEKIEENRLVRSQRRARPTIPLCQCESERELCGTSVADVITSTLHQRDMRVVPIHEQTDAEADGQEYQHDQRDRVDGLAGLVQRRVGDRNDVLITDRDRERRVLGQIE